MVSYARLPKVTPSGLEDASYQATIAARMPALTSIPNPKFNFRMTLDAKLLTHIAREADKWQIGAAERDGRDPVSRAIEADIADRFPHADMEVLERYLLAHSPSFVFVDVFDRTGRRDSARIPVSGVSAPMRGVAYVANLDGTLPPPSLRDARDVPEATIPYFARLATARDVAKDVSREGPTRWVARFRKEIGRVPRWHEIEKAFPVIGEWLDMRREAASRPRSLTPEAAS